MIMLYQKGVDKMKRRTSERRFKCPNCNYILTAYKKSSRMTSKGHPKKLYCPFCKNTHNFIQLSKWD